MHVQRDHSRPPMDPDELRPADEAILDVLGDGRATKGLLIDETGYSRNTVYNRLNVLEAADHVACVHQSTRLFELVDDPRRAPTAEPVADAAATWRDLLAEWDPDDQVNTPRARAAAESVVAWIDSQDQPQQRGDVVEWAEGGDHYYAPSTLWTKIAQPALSYLQEHDAVTWTANVGYDVVE